MSHTKDGDHEEPSTDRPISLLPVLSKVLERIAHNQFHNHNNDKLQQVQTSRAISYAAKGSWSYYPNDETA